MPTLYLPFYFRTGADMATWREMPTSRKSTCLVPCTGEQTGRAQVCLWLSVQASSLQTGPSSDQPSVSSTSGYELWPYVSGSGMALWEWCTPRK